MSDLARAVARERLTRTQPEWGWGKPPEEVWPYVEPDTLADLVKLRQSIEDTAVQTATEVLEAYAAVTTQGVAA